MVATGSFNRRSVIAALGIGGLGLGLGSTTFAAPPTVDQGGVVGSPAPTVSDHPLTGLWLAMIRLPSNPQLSVAVPSIFGADGLALLMFPTTVQNGSDIHISGVAIGTWEPIDQRKGHFTVVQALADVDGGYSGSLTIDGYPSVSDDGLRFEENVDESIVTLRDSTNIVRSVLNGGTMKTMAAHRMAPGYAGFMDLDPLDPRTP